MVRVDVGRDFWRSSCPSLQHKQGHLDFVAKDHIQMAFEYLQCVRLHNVPGQPVPVLSLPHWEKVVSDVQRETPVFQFVSFSPGPITGYHWKEPGYHWKEPLPSPFSYSYTLVRPPPSFLFYELNSPSSLSLYS